MPWRFRKSIRIAKGVNLNLSRRGPSVSIGIPGTGIYWTSRGAGRARKAKPGAGCLSRAFGYLTLIVLAFLGLVIVSAISSSPRATYQPGRPGMGPAPRSQPGPELIPASRPIPDQPSEQPAAPVVPQATPEPKAEVDEAAATFRTQVDALGLSEADRRVVWRELAIADNRTTWEANRLFDATTKFQEQARHRKDALERYRQAVLDAHGLDEAAGSLISTEGFVEKWPLPDYPGFDVIEAARDLQLHVYATRGELRYHRQGCRLLEHSVVRVPLHKALARPGARPCGYCNP